MMIVVIHISPINQEEVDLSTEYGVVAKKSLSMTGVGVVVLSQREVVQTKTAEMAAPNLIPPALPLF